jgi:hypothetical protein
VASLRSAEQLSVVPLKSVMVGSVAYFCIAVSVHESWETDWNQAMTEASRPLTGF